MDMITLAMARAYTDSQRLASVEKETVVILPETTVTAKCYEPGRTDAGFTPSNGELFFPSTFAIGSEVIAVLDGVRYPCTVVGESLKDWYIGNMNVVNKDAPDTGEPFKFEYFLDLPSSGLLLSHTAQNPSEGEHTFAIYQETETIHPIEAKYLPGVCLPVVELKTVIVITNSETAPLTEADTASLSAYDDYPCAVLKFRDTDGAIRTGVFSRVSAGSNSLLWTWSHFDMSYNSTIRITISAELEKYTCEVF